MPGFRRAQLRGSDELFRNTTGQAGATRGGGNREPVLPVEVDADPVHRVPMSEPAPREGHLIRLTDEEIQVLSDAVQRLKYPQKLGSKPPVEEYERLEELRQKLLSA